MVPDTFSCMTTPRDETRRDFLLALAKAAAFVPPLMATVAVRPLAGQGGGKGASGVGGGTSTVGSLSPTAQTLTTPTFDTQGQTTAPWGSEAPAQAPPWSRPPPTQTGR